MTSRHNPSVCPICTELPPKDLMSDEAFFQFLDGCRDQLREQQSDFMSRMLPDAWWHYDLEAPSLTLGTEVYPVTILGSFNEADSTWCWAWANESFTETVREDAERVCELYERTDFMMLGEPVVPATTAQAQDLAALAIHYLGASALFRVPTDSATIYLALYPIPDDELGE